MEKPLHDTTPSSVVRAELAGAFGVDSSPMQYPDHILPSIVRPSRETIEAVRFDRAMSDQYADDAAALSDMEWYLF